MINNPKNIGFAFVALAFMATLLIATPSVKAEVMRDLYTASWPVSDQSVSVRNRALSNAFGQVLVRASGHKKVLNASSIQATLGDAASYMRLYSYKKLSLQEQKIYKKPLLLKVSFEPKAILKLLKDSGQPVWNNNRPSGAYWIAVERNGERNISVDGQGAAAIAARKEANNRGLPISLPLMDLDDSTSVTAADVWGKFSAPVKKASKRYNTDYIVMGSLSEVTGGWKGNWVVDLGNDNMRFSTQAASSQQAVSKMVTRVADRLATKLAVVLSNQTETDYIMIQGIDSIESFAKAQSLLKNLSMVTKASAIEVREGSILFEVKLQSATRYLIDALELSNNLRRSTTDGFDTGELSQQALVYSWRN